jgi:hypothetical protein
VEGNYSFIIIFLTVEERKKMIKKKYGKEEESPLSFSPSMMERRQPGVFFFLLPSYPIDTCFPNGIFPEKLQYFNFLKNKYLSPNIFLPKKSPKFSSGLVVMDFYHHTDTPNVCVSFSC